MKKLFLLFHNKYFDPGLWLFVHISVPALFVLSLFFADNVRINTLLLDMLPQPGNSKRAVIADKILTERNSREIIILSASADFESAKKSAVLLYEKLNYLPAIESISLYFDSSVIEQFRQFIYDYRFVITDDETLLLLETGMAEEIALDALASAYGGFSFSSLENLDTDPFLLSERLMQSFLSNNLLSGGNLDLKDDVLSADIDGIRHVLLRITLSPQAVSVSGGNKAIKEIYTAAESVKETIHSVEFYFSGVPFHSYESSSKAQKEISIISTFALIIILLLFLYIYRSPLPVLFSAGAITVSLLMAVSAALLVFREIHILTFVFGTTLIGTCIDYSVHFFSHWKGNTALKDGYAVRSHISKSIIMSFISTEICFFIFLFAPFPILKQFAVFSMTGLLSSFLTAYYIYPRLKMPKAEKRKINLLDGRFSLKLQKLLPSPFIKNTALCVLAAVAVAVLIYNSQNIKIENDIRAFYSMSDSLMESETRASLLFDRGASFWYFIVSGSTPEETLQNEEKLSFRLKEEINLGILGSFLGTTTFVPSVKTQKRTYELMKDLLPLAENQYEYLGFPPEYSNIFLKEFASRELYALPKDVPSAGGAADLWIGEVNGQYYSCILPFNSADDNIFRSIADEYDFVHFISKASDISRDLNTITITILYLFLAAYLVISIIILIAYPVRDGIKICAVPVLLALCAIAVLSLSKIPVGFFSAAGLILVFGLGLDYIFYMTGSKKKGSEKFTILATALSFTTTFLSFGALILSSFMPVHIFGLTVSAGLCSAFVSSMLLSRANPPCKDSEKQRDVQNL